MKHLLNPISRTFFAGLLVLAGCFSVAGKANAIPVTVGYDYEASGANFATVVVPSALPGGDSEFDLLVGAAAISSRQECHLIFCRSILSGSARLLFRV